MIISNAVLDLDIYLTKGRKHEEPYGGSPVLDSKPGHPEHETRC
jgi:hypothetical protein